MNHTSVKMMVGCGVLTCFALDEGGGGIEEVPRERRQICRLLHYLMLTILALKHWTWHVLCGECGDDYITLSILLLL